MLDYLVTSKVRRLLLLLLWREGVQATATQLAEQAGVALAAVQGELKEMHQRGLVTCERVGKKDVFSANRQYRHAEVLVALAGTAPPNVHVAKVERSEIERRLKTLGAPLRDVEPMPLEPLSVVETLLQGSEHARRNATVARTLPLCVWTVRDDLDARVLATAHARAETRHALGFFVELAGDLGGDRRLVGLAEALRDQRITAIRPFFFEGATRSGAVEFPLAHKWGFEMRMDRESFRSLFAKYVRDA